MEIYDLSSWNGYRYLHYEYGNLYIKADKISSLKVKYRLQSYIQNVRVCNSMQIKERRPYSNLCYLLKDRALLKKYKFSMESPFKNLMYMNPILKIKVPLNTSLDLG